MRTFYSPNVSLNSTMTKMGVQSPAFLALLLAIVFSLLVPSFFAPAPAAADCVDYNAISRIISISCSTTFDHIASHVTDPSALTDLGNGEWILGVNVNVLDGAKLTIAAPAVSWLKITGSNGITVYGILDIKDSKITSWDTSKSSPIDQKADGSVPRTYINFRGSEGGVISGAEIAYIGYNYVGHRGIDLFGDGPSHDLTITGNSKFHDNWRAFYSSGGANHLVIEDSEFYHNDFGYAVDAHQQTSYLRVSNNNVHDNDAIGIICALQCVNVLFENNIVHDNNDTGLFFSRGTINSIMRNNEAYNQPVAFAISIYQSQNNEVYGNTIRNSLNGITVHNPNPPDIYGKSSGNVIHDNFFDNVQIAIRAKASAENTFTNNSFGNITGDYFLISQSAIITIENQDFDGVRIRGDPGTNEVTIQNSGKIEIEGVVYNTDVTPYNAVLNSKVITVNSVHNQPPRANLTATPTSVEEEKTASIDGGSSTDDSGIVQYTFEQVAGTSGTITVDPTDPAKAVFTAPSVDGNETATLKLTVTDVEGATDSTTTDIRVIDIPEVPEPPRNATTLALDSISDLPWSGIITITGRLTDNSASDSGISGATISFDGNGADNLPDVETASDGSFTVTGASPPSASTGWQVQAHYAGNSAYLPFSSPVRNYNTLVHLVSLTVTSASSSLPWGMPTSFTATLTDSSAGGIPIGSKNIHLDGTGVVGVSDKTTSAIDGGATTTGTAPNNVGDSWTYQAHFAGDALYTSKDSDVNNYSTTKHSASLTITSSSSTIPWGMPTSFTAILTDASAGNIPVGGKTIHLDGTGITGVSDKTTGTDGSITATGTAPTTVGTSWTYQAHFADDSLYTTADSAAKTYSTTKHSVILSVSSGSTTIPWGMPTSFTATLTDSSAGGIPIGSKNIHLDGTGVVGVSDKTTGTDGSITTTGTAPTTVGTSWTYQAHFAGDALYSQKDSTANTYSTSKHIVTLSLSVSPISVKKGASYTVSGTLTDSTTPRPLASKTITFTADSPIKISSKTTNTNGLFSSTQSAPTTIKTYNIQAHFAGDALYSPKDSDKKTLTVTK